MMIRRLYNFDKKFKTIDARFLCTSYRNIYDVVIVGGGMVGASLAASLGNNLYTSQLKLALIDQKIPVDRIGDKGLEEYPELRVSTLTPKSIQFLKNCQSWENVKPPKSASFTHMQVWDYNSSGCIQWNARDIGLDEMGVVVENSLIQSSCLKSAKENCDIEIMMPCSIKKLKIPSLLENEKIKDDLVEIELDNDEIIKTKLIVGADGGMSKIREMSGMRMVSCDYEQQGIVVTVEADDKGSEVKRAWQRFLPTGPIALLPVRDNLYNIVWTVTNDMAIKLKQADHESFIKAVNEAFHGRNTRITGNVFKISDNYVEAPNILSIKGSAPQSFPLKLMYSGNYVTSRLALIGDAAHVIHPLAGQGVNLGFGDAERLCEVINKLCKNGIDIGSESMLKTEYESVRKIENNTMMFALDGIKRIFSSEMTNIFNMRGIGLEMINMSKPVKNEIMMHAMGIKSISNELKKFI